MTKEEIIKELDQTKDALEILLLMGANDENLVDKKRALENELRRLENRNS